MPLSNQVLAAAARRSAQAQASRMGRTRPGRAVAAPQKPKQSKIPPPVNPLAPLSDAQINSEADRRVNEVLGPQEAEAQRASQARIAAIQGAAKAAAEMMGHIPGAVQGIYDAAQKEIEGITSSYSGQMKDRITQAQGAADQFAATQGAPAPGKVDPTALGDVSYHLGAAIPAADLASQGAAQASLAAEQPGVVAAGAVQDIHQAAAQGEQALLDLAAKRPELRSQVLDELYKRETDKLSARLQERQVVVQEKQQRTQQQAQSLYERQFGETVRHHAAGEATANQRARTAEKNYQLAVKKYNKSVQNAADQGRQVNASASKDLGYLVDQYGDPIKGPKGNRILIPKANQPGSKKGRGTAAERHPYQYAVKGASDDLAKQKHPSSAADTSGGRDFNGEVTYLMSAYGLTRKQARKAAIAAGWKPKGTKKNPYPNQPYGYTPGG
jgi:hypothetical protein